MPSRFMGFYYDLLQLRGRIEVILDAARALGYIDANRANPARWRGHLDKLLPKRSKLSHGHHAAMPYADVPAFVAQLRAMDRRLDAGSGNSTWPTACGRSPPRGPRPGPNIVCH